MNLIAEERLGSGPRNAGLAEHAGSLAPGASPSPERTAGGLPSLPMRVSRRNRISKRELVNITSQLAIMTQSGIDVATALDSLARQSRHPSQREMLTAIHQEVIGGKSFSNALKAYDYVFGSTYIASARAGEASGCLPSVLAQLTKLQRSEMRLRSIIRTLMAYPALLASVSTLVVMGMVVFVLPQFAKIFADFDTPLPAITQFLIGVSVELRVRFWLWGPLLGLLVFGVSAVRLSEPGRRWCDHLLLHVVYVRGVTRPLLIGRVCRLLGLMIENGVPLLDSLRIARSAIRNTHYQDLFAALEENVLNGRGLGDALLQRDFVPAAAAETILTAERTGSLGNVTQLIGEHYEEEGEARLRELVAILEPAITVGMGLIVAFVVLAVMLPMFDIATFANH